ncbi:MAG: hypothetical protein AB4911_08935 [Oscillochloridaceae bacterium umkhey_bin13]
MSLDAALRRNPTSNIENSTWYGERPRLVLLWATAVPFDGLALGFWPELYAQEGIARSILAALLLWAFP